MRAGVRACMGLSRAPTEAVAAADLPVCAPRQRRPSSTLSTLQGVRQHGIGLASRGMTWHDVAWLQRHGNAERGRADGRGLPRGRARALVLLRIGAAWD